MEKSKGFTLIEVALFLAITGLLFAAVTVGVQNSIFQQRYNDSVQNFAEFLRSVYNEVTSIEGIGAGRSEKAIYGRLITFGENGRYGSSGDDNRNAIFVYDVVGDVKDTGTGSALEKLIALNTNVIIVDKESEGTPIKPAGIIESYTPRWTAEIENTDNYEPFRGALLIVRHPSSGTVYTFVKDDGGTIEVADKFNSVDAGYADLIEKKKRATTEAEKAQIQQQIDSIVASNYENILKEYLDENTEGSFKIKQVNFCVNPFGGEPSSLRRNIRIEAGARNASGVEIIAQSSKDNKCIISE